MGRNPYKIKRHKSIYGNSGRRLAWRVLLFVVAGGLLFGVGWVLYSPVSEFISSQRNRKNPLSDSLNIGESNNTASQGQEAPPKVEPLPLPSQEPTLQLPTIKATAFLPNDTVANRTTFLSALSKAKVKGYDSVMVGLKLRDGTVTYPINYRPELDSSYTASSAVDLKETADLISAAGMTPVASIHTFRDPTYPLSDKTAAIKYMDEGFYWVDDAPSKGGQPWLDPFSQVAQDYVTKLVDDAIDAGFKEIVLESVQFPEGYALDKIGYGQNAEVDKNLFLKNYIEDMKTHASEKGALLAPMLPATALLGGSTAPTFGDPAGFATGWVAVNVELASFGNSFSSAQVSIPSPSVNPYNTVKTAAAALATKLPQVQVTALVQGSGLSQEDVDSQVKGLSESGITRYIVDNPPL